MSTSLALPVDLPDGCNPVMPKELKGDALPVLVRLAVVSLD
jgi:hypothetical protein